MPGALPHSSQPASWAEPHQAVLAAAAVIADVRELEPLLRALAVAGTQALGADFGATFFDVGGSNERVACSEEGHPAAPAVVALRSLLFAPGAALGEGADEPVARASLAAAEAGLRSFVAAPILTSSGAPLGGLCFGHGQPGHFDERARSALGAFASLARISLDRVNRERALREREVVHERRARQVALQMAVGAALTKATAAAEMLGLCAQALVDNLDAAFARVWTLDAAGEVLELQASAGLYTHLDGAHARVPVGHLEIGLIAKERAPHLTNDVPIDPRVSDRFWAIREGMVAFAGYPLLVEERLVGVVALFSRVRLESDTLDAIASVADVIAVGLDRLARRASGAIDNARLYELAQAMRERSEAANRSKDEFLAMVSHELRTPLNAILGWTRLLRSDRLDAAARDRTLATIERNARVQAQLIEDLLDISRIATKGLRLSIAEVSLGDAVQAAVDSLLPEADAKAVDLQVALDEAAPRVRGDAERLQQVAWNLLSNAINACPRGGTVRVLLAHAGEHVDLVVEDDGHGIARAFLPHVFERFRQAETGSTRSRGGLGLGLAIVRHLVDLHGGAVTAESEGEGRGARFRVCLPTPSARAGHDPGADPDAPPKSETFATPSAPAAAAELGGVRVLVVDDEPDARELLATLLTQCGARVTSAASAAEAFAAFDAATPDVLVSDIAMPGEDGYQLLRRVRARPPERGGRTPAIALTAFTRPTDKRRALDAGFDCHLGKPVDPDGLIATIAELSARPSRELARR